MFAEKIEHKFFKILKNAEIISPEPLGKKDVLIAGDKIAAVEDEIDPSGFAGCETVDCSGKYLIPGFIDGHVHMLGGGGGAGYGSAARELEATEAFLAGTTTIIGCLGINTVSRLPIQLVGKARSLKGRGLNVYIVFGGFELPPKTITGDIKEDMYLIPELLGVGEPALSDLRSSQASLEYLKKLVSEVHVGGRLSGKSAIVQFHLGDAPQGTKPLHDMLPDAPLKNIRALHFNRNEQLMEEAPGWAAKGGYIDITSPLCPPQHKRGVSVPDAIVTFREKGVDDTLITVSTDGNGVSTLFGLAQIERFPLELMHRDFVATVKEKKIPIHEAIRYFSTNSADSFGFAGKGRIAVGCDADVVALDKEALSVQTVISSGWLVVENGERVNAERLDG